MTDLAPSAGEAITTVLVVDDEPRVLDALEAILAAEFRILRAEGGAAALPLLASEDVAVMITDYRMPGMTGVELCRRGQEVAPESPAHHPHRLHRRRQLDGGHQYRPHLALRAQAVGSRDLLLVVRRAAERWRLERENARLRDELELAYNALRREAAEARERPISFDRLVGHQTGLRRAVGLARKVLDGDTTVLLLGETGTGKELFARLLHDNGPRRAARFVAQNCGALPETLLESELFGHARGAFTGATGERRGLFEEADGSTVFLDEVGEMSPAMQLRLLRVLQEGEVRRLGAPGVRKVNVRVIAATNADLEADVDAGRFRRDLYYRLNVFPISLPPLRERTEDIPVLAETFLRPACRRARRAVPSISPEAMALLQAYPFPGNVRELENEIERAVALAEDGRPIGPEHLSDRMRAARGMSRPGTLAEAIEQLKQRMIEDALRDCGTKTRAAERLGLSRQSFQQMLKRRQP